MIKYVSVIGLEVHTQLCTESKIFCGCANIFGSQPNREVCPICLGLPGTLPVLNKKVIEFAIMTGLAFDCRIADSVKMDRKNYFYPDLTKAYQISQFDNPICADGFLTIDIPSSSTSKRIGITRIHIEEDAGKLIHDEEGSFSKVDYNRAGVPLLEIVSEPDIRTAEEAFFYLKGIKAILKYIGVSDCNMQEGSLRCDANISIMPEGASEFGTRAEIKNMNSFRGVQNAIEYEIKRQKKCLDSGQTIVQETRLWNPNQEKTFSMRTKESSHEYRYFPEPDIPQFSLKNLFSCEKIAQSLPELPQKRKQRFIDQYSLPSYDAETLTIRKSLADFFENILTFINKPKLVSNWVMGAFLQALNTSGLTEIDSKVSPEEFAKLLKYVDEETLTSKNAKKVFEMMFETGESCSKIIEDHNLQPINDISQVESIVQAIVEKYPKSIEDYKKGQKKALMFLMGQVMRETKGKSNPRIVNELILKYLD